MPEESHALSSPRIAPKARKRPASSANPAKLLGKSLSVLAGLGSLALLMGFPAVALQFRAFGVPIDFAPERSFLVAGALPTIVLLLATFASTRPIAFQVDDTKSEGRQALALLRHAPAMIVVGWPLLASAYALCAAALVRIVGGWCVVLFHVSDRIETWRWVLGALVLVPSWGFAYWFGSRRRATNPSQTNHSQLRAMIPGIVLSIGGLALILHAGAGTYALFAVALLVVTVLLMVALARLFPRWKKRVVAGAVQFLIRFASFVSLSSVVLGSFLTAPIFAEAARSSLVVLGVLPPSAPHGPWLMLSMVSALLTSHGTAVVTGRLLAGQPALAGPSFNDAFLGTSWSDPLVRLGLRIARSAHVILVASLWLIYVFGAYPLIPRTFLGGRPGCVAGAATAKLPSAVERPRPPGRAATDQFNFDRLCVLVATSDDVVLCGSDLPPAACVVLKRDDVSSLVTYGGSLPVR